MRRSARLLLAACLGLATTAPAQAATDTALQAAIAGPHRTPEARARDAARHPAETLAFFGIRPDMTVVEIWPGGGWYAEVLAPYLREHGQYYAAGFVVDSDDAPAYRKRIQKRFEAKLAAEPSVYDRTRLTAVGPPDRWTIAPAGSADLVLTFRNVHNWLAGGYDAEMFRAFYTALKPGGILGVVEHRAPEGTDFETMKRSGYVTEARVRELAGDAGFEFVAASPVNANPKDSADHPEGVWTLPPTLKLGDQDREKYLAIGESDRMTLKFVKPAH
ncbi:MAG: methyltransferase [Nevskiales bacterium]|nr:methyltransferase [Nevskiales bacterium]